MKDILEDVQQKRRELVDLEESNVPSMWAWMSGLEIVSLLVFVLVQLTFFEKLMTPVSII